MAGMTGPGKPYRSHTRLMRDLLGALEAEADIPVTRLLFVANMSHVRLMDYLAEARGRGWIEERGDGSRRTWRATDDGRRVLRELRRMEEALLDFGLAL